MDKKEKSTMDPRKQATLLNYHKAIQDSVDINKIWTEMESIFTDQEQHSIQSLRGKDQMRRFVDLLARKDDQAFDSLVRVLRKNYRWLSTRLRQGVKDEEKRVLKAEKGIRQKITLALLTARISERQKEEITSRVSHVMKEELNDKALRVSIPDHRAAAELDSINKQLKQMINEELDPMLYGRVQDTDLTNSEINEVISKLQNLLVEMNVIQDCYHKMAVHSLAGHGTPLPNILRQKIEETQTSIKLLEKEKRDLTREKAELSREKNEQRQELADLESQNRSLELQNRTLNIERERLDDEVRKTSRLRDSIEIEKRKTEDEKIWMESMVDNLEGENRNISLKNKRLLDINQKLTRDNQKMASENEHLRKEIQGYYGTDGKSILQHENKILTETRIKLKADLGRMDSEKRQLVIKNQKMEYENDNLREQKRRLMIDKRKYWEENQALRREAKRLALGKYESTLTLPQIKDLNRSRASVRFSDQSYDDDKKSARTPRSRRSIRSTTPAGRKTSTHSQNHGSRKSSTHSQNNGSRKSSKNYSPGSSNGKAKTSRSPERGHDRDRTKLPSTGTTAYPHPKSEPNSRGRNKSKERDRYQSNRRNRSDSKERRRSDSNERRSQSKAQDKYESKERRSESNERRRSQSNGQDKYESKERGRNESKGRDRYESDRDRSQSKGRGRDRNDADERERNPSKGRDRNESLQRASEYDYRNSQNSSRYTVRQGNQA